MHNLLAYTIDQYTKPYIELLTVSPYGATV